MAAGWFVLWGPGGFFQNNQGSIRGDENSRRLNGGTGITGSKAEGEKDKKRTVINLERIERNGIILDVVKEFVLRYKTVIYREQTTADSSCVLVYGYKKSDPYENEDDISALDIDLITNIHDMLEIEKALRACTRNRPLYFWKPQ